MSFIQQYLQYVDYVSVLSRALDRVAEARAKINTSSKYAFETSLKNYMRAVEALYVILLPSLEPGNIRRQLLEARKCNPSAKAIELLDSIVKNILQELDRKNILLRKRLIEVGVAEVSPNANSVQED